MVISRQSIDAVTLYGVSYDITQRAFTYIWKCYLFPVKGWSEWANSYLEGGCPQEFRSALCPHLAPCHRRKYRPVPPTPASQPRNFFLMIGKQKGKLTRLRALLLVWPKRRDERRVRRKRNHSKRGYPLWNGGSLELKTTSWLHFISGAVVVVPERFSQGEWVITSDSVLLFVW